MYVQDGNGQDLLEHKGGDRYGIGPEYAINYANPKGKRIQIMFTASSLWPAFPGAGLVRTRTPPYDPDS